MAETKPCKTCGETAYHNQGISKKTNEPYENWKCRGGHTEWISKLPSKKPYTSKTGQISPKNTQESASQIVAMRKLYALILAVAHLSGIKTEDIDAELERMSYQGK